LLYKYKNEIHCNEVAILPYYIANLNIEATFKQKMGVYEEFKNICFVDTLDNVGFEFKGKQRTMFSLSSENSVRINAQNKRKISVIIGNPPYNANQLNENENNKNREYPIIDRRIKDTYIKHSTAQKTKVYDMYARFLRWASDRIDKNGIVAFVSNNSFIDRRTYDGFRKCVADEFNEMHIINLKGDARTSGERRRQEGGNVFSNEIRVGIAVYFLIKKDKKEKFRIYYNAIGDYVKVHDKKAYLADHKIQELNFELLEPDKANNWLNVQNGDEFEQMLPLIGDKDSLFRFHSLGISTNRDDWVFDLNSASLTEKIKYFIKSYNNQCKTLEGISEDDLNKRIVFDIKWSEALKKKLLQGAILQFSKQLITNLNYRPFFTWLYYSDKNLSDRLTANHFEIFGSNLCSVNKAICFSGIGSSKPFSVLAIDKIWGLDFLEKTQAVPIYHYDGNGHYCDNIADWGLKQFQEHYKNKKITKEDMFHYVYAVLHNPEYREKYEIKLKRGFPRIPFYDDFQQWSKWGKELMDLHINFETAAPFNLKRVEKVPPKQKRPKLLDVVPTNQLPESEQAERSPKPRLKADKEHGSIELDDRTTLTGVPKEAWEYKLGNRSALEWVLEQYKEYKPSDPTIAEKFNTYRFADYKEKVIDLLKRVCTVSIKTMEIVSAFEK